MKIPEALEPVERYKKYEEPLDALLAELELGEVTGGGTMAREGRIEYCGIDVELTDLDRGIEVLRQVLQAQGAPRNTVLEIEPDETGAGGASIRVWD